jgi:hypothetical protein
MRVTIAHLEAKRPSVLAASPLRLRDHDRAHLHELVGLCARQLIACLNRLHLAFGALRLALQAREVLAFIDEIVFARLERPKEVVERLLLRLRGKAVQVHALAQDAVPLRLRAAEVGAVAPCRAIVVQVRKAAQVVVEIAQPVPPVPQG